MEQKRSVSVRASFQKMFGYLRTKCTVFKEVLEDGSWFLSSPLRNIRDIYFDVTNGVKSVVYYLPIIWKSRNWDHGFCLDLYIASLKRLRSCLKNSEVADMSNEVKELNLIIKMLSVYNSEEHTNTYKKEEAELFKRFNLKSSDMAFDFSLKPSVSGLTPVRFIYEKKLSGAQRIEFSKAHNKLYLEENDRKNQYFKKALIMIYRKSNRFWD